MDLPSKQVHDTLTKAGVTSLFHANSVITACQFLRAGALLSRGTVDRRKLYQTPQSSDAIDRNYGIWFDVFTDTVDIHNRASRANLYGPVLFVFDIKMVRVAYTGRIWVTKRNPTKWEGLKHEQRWFHSIEELEQKFDHGKFDQMVVFRHCGGELPFTSFLTEIVIDDPLLKLTDDNVNYYSMAYGAIRLAMTDGGIDVPVKKRTCRNVCACKTNYHGNKTRTKTMFVPGV